MEDHMPDTAWLLTLLGIFCPDDEIFAKSYRYVPQKKSTLEITFDNSDAFYENLPPLTEKEIRSTNRIRLSQDQRNQLMLNRLEERK